MVVAHNEQHDWQPLDCTPLNPRFSRCTRCGVTRGRQASGGNLLVSHPGRQLWPRPSI